MFLKEEEKNIITGILGTLAIHLVILIVFLVGRINKVHNISREPLVVEFDDQVLKTLQQQMEQKKVEESKIQPLPQQEVHNIAVNTANKLENKISTEKYIEEVKQELGIKDLNQHLDRSTGTEPVVQSEKEEKKPAKKAAFKGRTTTEVNLKDREIRHQEIPVYMCERGGRVVVDITVNTDGEVTSASINSSTTNEECITQSALNAAKLFLFSYKPDAEPRQHGTITFEFFAQ